MQSGCGLIQYMILVKKRKNFTRFEQLACQMMNIILADKHS